MNPNSSVGVLIGDHLSHPIFLFVKQDGGTTDMAFPLTTMEAIEFARALIKKSAFAGANSLPVELNIMPQTKPVVYSITLTPEGSRELAQRILDCVKEFRRKGCSHD